MAQLFGGESFWQRRRWTCEVRRFGTGRERRIMERIGWERRV
jgi:hypothetical protein